MVPIPVEVWERLKESLKGGRRVRVVLELDDGVVVAADFTDHVSCAVPKDDGRK